MSVGFRAGGSHALSLSLSPFCREWVARVASPRPTAEAAPLRVGELAARERCQDEVAQVKTALDKACALEVALVRDACQQEIVRVKECAARRGVEPPPAAIGCAPSDPKLPLRRRCLHTRTRPPPPSQPPPALPMLPTLPARALRTLSWGVVPLLCT